MSLRDTITEVGIGGSLLAEVVIPLNPVPASRPRVTRWGTYYLPTYRNWKAAAQKVLKTGTLNSEAELLVFVSVVVQRPKKPTYHYPSRGDVDNFAKAALDALTKAEGYWKDDKQITFLMVSKRWTEEGEQPHTLIEIYSP